MEKIVDLAENLTPIALIGAGGIGKTSIALTVLHHDRIKQRFGVDRRFIRCDQFPTSCSHLLSRLSNVIGAGIKNPEDLMSLRPFLSSREMLIVLDNAESILDPQGTDSDEIYSVVEELSQLDNICLCITSRLSAVPSDCETLDIPTLSIDAARNTFYRIYKNAERTELVDNVLNQLDFHPLSITLLATVAHQNKWGMERLGREWDRQRTRMLRTIRNKSLATTLELSLASPLFQELGPDARALLEVIAFFPQGVDENNLERLLPTVSDGANIFDKFCILSLTYRSGSFITMLAPLRDYLRPEDPKSSPLLCAAKEGYFTRMSVNITPSKPGYKEARWITSEDVNVEYLLDVFITIDPNSEGNWDACTNFMKHLLHHKPRYIILKPKIEGLPDGHRSKPECMSELAQLSKALGNYVEHKQLLTHTLRLWREQGNDRSVARVLGSLSDGNRRMGLYAEGIQMAKEALEILERLGKPGPQGRCLNSLARLYCSNNQLDAAEEAAFRMMDLFSKRGDQYWVCEAHRLLGVICRSKGDTEKAIHHLEVALGLASSFDWRNQLRRVHFSLAKLFLGEGRFDKAQAHVEPAKSYALNHLYHLGDVMALQAELWYRQGLTKEARSEALRAADMYEKLGAARSLERCRAFLRKIEKRQTGCEDESSDDGEFLVRKGAIYHAHHIMSRNGHRLRVIAPSTLPPAPRGGCLNAPFPTTPFFIFVIPTSLSFSCYTCLALLRFNCVFWTQGIEQSCFRVVFFEVIPPQATNTLSLRCAPISPLNFLIFFL